MIQINEKVRIRRLDERNLQLEEYRKIVNPKTKDERYDWVWLGYYGDLRSALNGVVKHCSTILIDEDLKNCKEVIKRLEEIKNEIIKTIGATNET